MDGDRFARAEDYTNAFLGMLYLVLVMGLVVIWGAWGYVAALALCAAVHKGIDWFGARRAAAEADWEERVATAIRRGR